MTDELFNVLKSEPGTVETFDIGGSPAVVKEVIKPPQKFIGEPYMGEDGRKYVPIKYHGVSLDFAPSRLKNNGVFYCIGKLSDSNVGGSALKWQSRLFDLLFGEDKAFQLLQDLSFNDDGDEDETVIIDFMRFLLEEVADAKN